MNGKTNITPPLPVRYNTDVLSSVGGMGTKTKDVFVAAADCSHAMIALTDIFLHEGICSAEIFTSDFDVYRRDRCFVQLGKDRCGSKLLAVHSLFKSIEIALTDSSAVID